MANLTMSWGDTYAFDVEITRAGVVLPITGMTVRFMAKYSQADPDADAVIVKSTVAVPPAAAGVVITDGPGGIARVTIDPADTAALPVATTTLCYEVKLEDGADVYTVAEGLLTVRPVVIRA